ncbi:hypothetical protein BO94DRAFT_539531 [Aspergillus sclerotioniger CBS 115572]|uniref:Uncharacterized protein n=1 Tax=Aspergillus sclerotioniger CBS 115572 TaxID=1450535 RepID=A0A317VB41_9EURO|nr:hypothetical protein BO94DRAFT_539531 [Aspergillus sclerotioniger CBS 115572]PWY71574.1 hypothetical protein BO94DRAFT_539531 [Aspergillus sclerotioniger CBS 115572]
MKETIRLVVSVVSLHHHYFSTQSFPPSTPPRQEKLDPSTWDTLGPETVLFTDFSPAWPLMLNLLADQLSFLLRTSPSGLRAKDAKVPASG